MRAFRWLSFGFLVSIVVLIVGTISAQDALQSSPYRVVGYYVSWAIYGREYYVTDIPADKLTHINYAFANISADHECILGDPWAEIEYPYPDDPAIDTVPYLGNFRQLNLLKAANPGLQILISVGGWTWSARFSDVAATEESRQIFATSCADFMEQYGFDGIDLDWEYPTGGGHPLNRERPEDEENFVLLLQAVRDELDARGEAAGRHYLLTIAAGASRSTYEPLDWERIHPLLDFINVMTYDMSGGWSPRTGFNAPLYDSTANPPEGVSTDSAMRGYVAMGVPADKLVLGVPFYGRGWSNVRAENNGLHQPYNGLPNGTWEPGAFDYADLVENYLNNGYERYWSDTANVPWLYNAETQIMISYDDPESMAIKAQYVRDNGFGGIMFWEVSSDDDESSLLTAIYETLNAPE